MITQKVKLKETFFLFLTVFGALTLTKVFFTISILFFFVIGRRVSSSRR